MAKEKEKKVREKINWKKEFKLAPGAKLLNDFNTLFQPIDDRAGNIGDKPSDHEWHKEAQQPEAYIDEQDRRYQAEGQAHDHLPIGTGIMQLFLKVRLHMATPPLLCPAIPSLQTPRYRLFPAWSQRKMGGPWFPEQD